ncbi:MAG: M28 family peptidase [Planctomycetales bacterium]|nr:M28 family peptidase [bacterium]UNM07463.1 MAG: M28 family peptidase [Planctomycetales bacterium]
MRPLTAALILIFACLLGCNASNSAKAQESGRNQDSQQGIDDPSLYLATRHFDERKAWTHMEKQVNFGFRVPGSSAHKACKEYIEAELQKQCDAVEVQEFRMKLGGEDTRMWNIVGRFNVTAKRRVMLAAHWDTRPTADMNTKASKKLPIQGANDGASGVSVLLELARVFNEHRPEVGLDLVFFDGEDYGPGLDMMFLGSKYYCNSMPDSEIATYNYGVLLDMVGDTDLVIRPENHSSNSVEVFLAAKALSDAMGYKVFRDSGALTIYDDHLSFIDRGMHFYDFIDFEYGPDNRYWHTTDDTIDNCSKESLKAIGEIVENLVFKFPDLYAPGS